MKIRRMLNVKLCGKLPGKYYIGLIIVSVYLLIYLCSFALRANEPLRGYGDYSSEAATLIAGRNFAKVGFRALHFLGVHSPIVRVDDGEQFRYYTHYPPGGELIGGLFHKLGLGEIRYLRLFAAAFSCLGLLLFFSLVCEATGDIRLSMIGVFLVSISPFFYPYADSFFQAGFLNAFLFGTLLCFLYGSRYSTKSPGLGILLGGACWFFMFIQCWFSYEGIAFSVAFVIMYGRFVDQMTIRQTLGWALLLMSAIALFLLMHRMQVGWALGNFGASLNDLWGSFKAETYSAIPLFDKIKMLYWLFSPINLMSFTLILVFGIWIKLQGKLSRVWKYGRKNVGLILCLVVSAVPWVIIFRYHFMHETSKDFRHFIPGLSLAIAWVVLVLYRELGSKYLAKIILITFISLSLLETIDLITPPIKPGWEHLSVLDENISQNAICLVNVGSYAPMVYTNRPQIEGCLDQNKLNRTLKERHAEIDKYDEAYLIIFLRNDADSPVRSNVIEAGGLRYLSFLQHFIPFLNNIGDRMRMISVKDNRKRKKLLELVEQDDRFVHFMNIPKANADVFKLKNCVIRHEMGRRDILINKGKSL